MEGFKRKADCRRIFTVDFKRSVVGQIHSSEKTLAELSRELEIQPAVDRDGTTPARSGSLVPLW
jgi:transposase-like protein